MDDDTVVFTEDDAAQLRALLDDHHCEPRWWPHRLGETWTCDLCGHRYVVDTAAHCGGTARQAIRAGLLDPLTLGWRTA